MVAVVAEATGQDTERAIAAARAAADDERWASVPAPERGSFLLRVAAILRERSEKFALAESKDTGKRIDESRQDMSAIANCFECFAKIAAVNAGRIVDAGAPDVLSRVVHEPVGVCGMITPWNYPLLQAAWKIAPALAAGNLVLGAGEQAGAPLTSDPRVDLVFFTGGLVTGRVIAAEAASTVKTVALELGGKNPNVIFADAHYDAALEHALNGAFIHSGQVCSAGARLVIEESMAEKFVTDLVRRAEQIRLGGPFDEKAGTGALISEAHRDKVHAYVERAREQGARVRCGGGFADGPSADGSLDLSDGVIANDTNYGLAGAVWTQDAGRAQRGAGKLRCGTVWINDLGPYLPQAEWGGMKHSGVGRELGLHGLAEYQETKHIYQNTRPAVSGWFAER